MDKHKYCILVLFVTGITLCQAVENGWTQRPTPKVCSGTSYGLAHETGEQQRYENYRNMYTNCTFVAGNLEIIFLQERDNYDLSFLSSIKEITGYVLIVNVFADYVPLTSLIIVRGRNLFKTKEGKYYSLYVTLNYKPGNAGVGIKELRFTSLSEILEGNVFFYNNNMLCFENTIDWADILAKSSQNVSFHEDSKHPRRNCGECDPKCTFDGSYARHCWGAGPDMCQKPTKKLCAPQCNHRCFDKLPDQCCNPECAGGCDGPTSKDCWACKHFNNDSVCVPFCPKQKIYDTENYRYVDNPYAKYTYGTLCVDKCPSHLVVLGGGCVRSCGAKDMPDDNMHCQPCPQGICPKTCPGTSAFGSSDFIHANNLRNFTDCTVIDGNIRILPSTFDGDSHNNIPPMHPSNLSVLKTVREITGYLMVQGEHPDFTSLSMFENLEVINGREKDNIGASLNIYTTTLRSLDLMRLKHIKSKKVFVVDNQELCYAETINWRSIVSDPDQPLQVDGNRSPETCKQENQVCHNQCSSDGCWGAGSDHCLSCQNFTLEGECVESCDAIPGVYQESDTECKRCNPECDGMCTGPGGNQCQKCRHYKDGTYCLNKCPDIKYPNEQGVCTMCHEYCTDGCTGPMNNLGPNGCNRCEKVELDWEHNVTQCLKSKVKCGEMRHKRYYRMQYPVNGTDIKIEACAPCHPLCQTCWSNSSHNCPECTHFKQEGECVQNCSTSYYPDGANCLQCDSRCEQCFGPSNAECLVCKQYKVYTGSEDPKTFNCSDKCPELAPYKTTETNEKGDVETVCISEPYAGQSKGFVNQKKLAPVIGSVVGIVLVLGLIVIVVTVYCQKRAKALESKERLAARMSGLCEESEITPLTPTDAKPDMAKMRIIKESELRKGTMVGSGAFGTVYKGFWIPDGENVKIPVAIKVLQEGTSASQNQELLEEARVMAAVDNKYCVPILGVCMTAQMMLITPYMPLGCLLDYVRKNKDNIGSKVLLDWCAQIATGMAYLEDRGIVHRDLAARNVLVQNPKRVRVTDFGLSKLLDVNEEEFRAAGGKMPIKWLALECIQHRIFTHKSDVWSFGVTIWELCTYGQRPYENIRARDIPELLEKGERLPQPAICTIDVYMFMIKCWMLDAQSRPSFKELAEEFSKMAKDPGRYLFIMGDKLMRLPSHSTETRRDMFRNMSVSTDGPEEIVEAEEYLQPSDDEGSVSPTYPVYRPRHHRSNGKLERVKEENSGGSTYDNEQRQGRHHPQHHHQQPQHHNQHPHNQHPHNTSNQPVGLDTIIQPPPSPKQDLKYGGLEAAAALRKQREAEAAGSGRDSLKSRYSSDPCKVLSPLIPPPPPPTTLPPFQGGHADEYLPPAPPTPIGGRPLMANNGSNENVFFGPGEEVVKYKQPHQQLPVDEDDYLQPQSAQQLPKYLDVMQDDYLPPTPTTNQQHQPQPDVGIPDVTRGPIKYTQPSPRSNSSDFYGGGPVIAENPEYFDSHESDNNAHLSYDPTGRSSERQPLTASYNSPSTGGHQKQQPALVPEHDYYNEMDYLQKGHKVGNVAAQQPPSQSGRSSTSSPSSTSAGGGGVYIKPRTESVV